MSSGSSPERVHANLSSILFFSLPRIGKFFFFNPRWELAEIDDETEARKYEFQDSTKLKLLTYDLVLLTRTNGK